MRHLRSHRKAEGTDTLHIVIGLVLAAIVLVAFLFMIQSVKNWVDHILHPQNTPEDVSLASKKSYGRLNGDLKFMIDPAHIEKTARTGFATMVVPYSLGKEYVLVGFNKDPDANTCLKNPSTQEQFAKPTTCGKNACLCLCLLSAGCDKSLCMAYGDIDYFITLKADGHGKEAITGINDPLTNQQAYCMTLIGTSWPTTRNLYVERSIGAKNQVYVYMAGADSALNFNSIQARLLHVEPHPELAECDKLHGTLTSPPYNYIDNSGGSGTHFQIPPYAELDITPGTFTGGDGLSHDYEAEALVTVQGLGLKAYKTGSGLWYVTSYGDIAKDAIGGDNEAIITELEARLACRKLMQQVLETKK